MTTCLAIKMAESGIWSQLKIGWFGLPTDFYNMIIPGWPDSDSNSSNGSMSEHQRRSETVHGIIFKRRLDYLQGIVGSGWDVNETLLRPKFSESDEDDLDSPCYPRLDYLQSILDRDSSRYPVLEPWTALAEAVRQKWTEGVRILLEAGAKCKMPSASQNILILPKEDRRLRHNCPPELIQLLLKHGADPNDHDGLSEHIPLFFALIHYKDNKIVNLLLEHGADPNVVSNSGRGNDRKKCPLSIALDKKGVHKVVPLLKLFTQYGADVNYNLYGRLCLLHSLMASCYLYQTCFHREQMDLYFANGGDVHMEHDNEGTALDYANMKCVSTSSIRWLIRHGADTTTMDICKLKVYLTDSVISENHETLFLLLQTGMRVSHGVYAKLRNMETAIMEWEQDIELGDNELERRLNALWDLLLEAAQPWRIRRKSRKLTFPEHRAHQVDDLQEFSDESLNTYPEDDETDNEWWQSVLSYIRKMQDFLSQPQSLHWHCRRCVRDNLVSLQPSVVKTLPVPPILKRYILCHEI